MSRVQTGVTLLALIAVLALTTLLGVGSASEADALPPAGQDLLNVSAEVSVVSRLGQETISLAGLVEIVRSDPRTDGEFEVVDIEMVGLHLTGESITGPVSVSESPTLRSIGEIRSLQPLPDQFPASSRLGAFIEVRLPVSGGSPPVVHNQDPLELVAVSPLQTWPPVDATFEANPVATLHCAAGLALLPTLPAEICVTGVSMTFGEPKTPTPTLTPCPPDVCTPVPTPTVTPTSTMGPTATPSGATPTPRCVPAISSGNVFSDTLVEPLPIPQGSVSGVTNCILISNPSTIADLDVAIEISHSWVGDLIISLLHENTATTVILVDQPGALAPGAFGCSLNDIDTILDDEASEPVEDECAESTPTISGRFLPDEPLSVFDGETVIGAWTISVSDIRLGDAGGLVAWSLIVNDTVTPSAQAGDANCDGNVNSIDATLALQFGAGLVNSLGCEEAADVNGDGDISAIDAALILQFAAGLLSSLSS